MVNVENLINLFFPFLGLIQYLCLYKRNNKQAAQNLIVLSGLGFLLNLVHLCFVSSSEIRFELLLASLISFIAWNVQKYAYGYLDGDRQYSSFFLYLAAISLSSNAMVLSSEDFPFWLFWTITNLLLVMLMIHKSSWRAAKQAGLLSLGNLGISSICLGLSLYVLHHYPNHLAIAQLLLIIAAMAQSAIYPFHRWLLSSLNSPTPVSALMHAGIVNGGGILLIKYQSIFTNHSDLLWLVFGFGFITALIGGVWKLIQTDQKKMLACSTLAQMGFMFFQCGLGLFSAALAHLCWHGLFKAYLFFNSGSALHTKFKAEASRCNKFDYLWISIASLLAMICFAYTAQLALATANTHWILLGIVGMSAWQLSKNLVGKHHLLLDLSLIIICSSIYGLSIHCIEVCITPVNHIFGLPLNFIYIGAWLSLFLMWQILNSPLFKSLEKTKFWAWLYMTGLNASQPHPKTITSIREDYNY